MWICNILRYYIPISFLRLLVLTYQINAFPASTRVWFTNSKLIFLRFLPVFLETLPILHEVGLRNKVELFGKVSFHLHQISIHEIFSPQLKAPGKVIRFLELVHILSAMIYQGDVCKLEGLLLCCDWVSIPATISIHTLYFFET